MDLGKFAAEHLEPIITTIIGLVAGGLISLYFFRRAAPEKSLSWQMEADQWLVGSNAPPGLTMSYNGTPVKRPRLVALLMYNSGTVGIRQDDFLSPIRVHVAGADVISVDIEPVRMIDDREAEIIASPETDEVLLRAVTMNPGDAMRIRLIVDGGRKNAVEIAASIFEATTPITRDERLSSPSPAALSALSFAVVAGLSAFIVVSWAVIPFDGRPTPWWIWVIWAVFLILICVPVTRLVRAAHKQLRGDSRARRLRHLSSPDDQPLREADIV